MTGSPIRVCVALLCGLVLLAACAGPQGNPRARLAPEAPRQVELGRVPFFAQEDYLCGPAALAMVLDYSGLAVRPEDLVAQVYAPARQGSLPPAMVSAARRHGRLAYPLDAFDGLLQEVAAGHPVVVLLNLEVSWAPRWHYAVVIGYDLDAETVILRSGTEARRVLPFRRFRDAWRQAGRWGLAVLRPGTLPAGAEESRYLEAVLGLERARRWGAAARAYEAARARWPASLVAAMGLGNARYALGDLTGAAEAFGAAAWIHPEAAPAFNNLAQVLGELSRREAAVRAARRAVALGGSHSELYRATLATVTGARPPPTASPGTP